MSFVYWLSKFSHEAMLVELLFIACIAACYLLYLLVQKRRYGVAKRNIPDHVVRAFLVELLSSTEGFKNQLFGEDFKIGAKTVPLGAGEPAVAGADAGEVATMRSALAAALAKQDELLKQLNAITKDKASLESKLAAQPAPAASGGGGGDGDGKALREAQDKIAKLESKLAEYEVIEDDLANLKKYQQENKQLRAQLEALKGGAPAPAVPEPAVASAPAEEPAPQPEAVAVAPEPVSAAEPAPAAEVAANPPPAAEASPVAAAEESAAADKAAESFETLVDKVEESLAPTPVGASATDPAIASEAATAPPVSDAPAAAPAAPAAAAAAPVKEKSDADLLNEFERMLSS